MLIRYVWVYIYKRFFVWLCRSVDLRDFERVQLIPEFRFSDSKIVKIECYNLIKITSVDLMVNWPRGWAQWYQTYEWMVSDRLQSVLQIWPWNDRVQIQQPQKQIDTMVKYFRRFFLYVFCYFLFNIDTKTSL